MDFRPKKCPGVPERAQKPLGSALEALGQISKISLFWLRIFQFWSQKPWFLADFYNIFWKSEKNYHKSFYRYRPTSRWQIRMVLIIIAVFVTGFELWHKKMAKKVQFSTFPKNVIFPKKKFFNRDETGTVGFAVPNKAHMQKIRKIPRTVFEIATFFQGGVQW